MNLKKYEDKGLSGLSNLGNTCFINSCLQILSHTYELNNFLDKNNQHYRQKIRKNHDSVLLIEWDDLRKLLWNSNCIISPERFIKIIQTVAENKNREIFTGYDQNDISEFFLFVIDCFHNSLSRETKMCISGNPTNETDNIAIQCFEMIINMYSKDYSEILDLFSGVSVSKIINLKTNKNIKNIPEPYFIINLPIPDYKNEPSLLDCFDHYIEGEILENENAWYNEDIKEKINIKKKIEFWSFPKILVIDIKRFTNYNKKNQKLVSFPIDNLDLSEYVIGYKKEEYKYELYGVCNHSGGLLGGHYTSFIKNANGKWYEFNDTCIKEIHNINLIISPKAYVLFYRKLTNII